MTRRSGGFRGAKPTWTTTSTSGIFGMEDVVDLKADGKWPRGPVAPTSLAGTGGDGQVALTWTAPATPHGTIADYLVEYTPAAGSPTVVATGSTAAAYTLTGLTSDTEYTIRVAAVNHTRGDWSSSVAVTPSAVVSDAADWAARVTANSGTYDSATLAAVEDFCDAIDAAGLRDKFYRLNLMTGSDLNAVVVPLYLGPVAGGTTYGNSTDTNNNFVSGDYTLAGGLDGDGSTKYLETGLSTATLPSLTNAHIAAWKGAGSISGGGGSVRGLIATRESGDSHHYRLASGVTTMDTMFGGGVQATASTNLTSNGMMIGSRVSSTSLKLYWNGSSVATVSTSTSPISGSNTFKVFSEFYSGSPQDYWPHAIKAYSIGIGLSDSDASAFYTALAAFMTAIGR